MTGFAGSAWSTYRGKAIIFYLTILHSLDFSTHFQCAANLSQAKALQYYYCYGSCQQSSDLGGSTGGGGRMSFSKSRSLAKCALLVINNNHQLPITFRSCLSPVLFKIFAHIHYYVTTSVSAVISSPESPLHFQSPLHYSAPFSQLQDWVDDGDFYVLRSLSLRLWCHYYHSNGIIIKVNRSRMRWQRSIASRTDLVVCTKSPCLGFNASTFFFFPQM